MLESLFHPDTVAVVGDFNEPTDLGYLLIENLLAGNFGGEIIPVCKKGGTLDGLDILPDLSSRKGDVDLVLIAVEAKNTPSAVESAVDAQTKAVIVLPENIDQANSDKITKNCLDHGVRLLGPGSIGILNTHTNLNAAAIESMPITGSVALFSQSGTLAAAAIDLSKDLGVGLSKVATTGKKAEVLIFDLLKDFAQCEQTKVIAGYIESITQGNSFVKAAELAAAQKPVVILKGGVKTKNTKTSESNRKDDIAYAAAFKRSGVVRAETLEELLDFASAFEALPQMNGNRTGIVTNSHGAGVMAQDTLPNPVKLIHESSVSDYGRALDTLIQDSNVDAIVAVITPRHDFCASEASQVIGAACSGSKKPLVAVVMGGSSMMEARGFLSGSKVENYPKLTRAARVLGACYEYATWKKLPARVVTRYPVNRRRVERILRRCTRTGLVEVPEISAKEILELHGFNVPEGRLASNALEAGELAGEIGFPVTLKLISPDGQNLSPAGKVRKNLASPDQVRDAFDLLVLRARDTLPSIRLDGVYVEKDHRDGVEVVLGMNRDPEFGPMLVFGLGGIFVEVMEDVAFHLAPITGDEAMEMLTRTRSYEILSKASGQGGVDIKAIAAGLQRISQLATDFPVISELEINPFVVSAVGGDSIVVDTKMTLISEGRIE